MSCWVYVFQVYGLSVLSRTDIVWDFCVGVHGEDEGGNGEVFGGLGDA